MRILLYGLPIFFIAYGLYRILKYYIKKFMGNYQEVTGTIVYNINNPVDSVSLELSTSLIAIFAGIFFLIMVIIYY